MAFWILAAGLFFLPLTNTILIEPLIAIVHNAREISALIVCLLFSVYVQNFRHIRQIDHLNKSLSIFMLFLIFSINASPKIKLIYSGENIGNLWEWKAYTIILIYYIFYLSFSHISLSLKDKENLCRIIGLTAILSSIYAILQSLGLDQAQVVRHHTEIGSPDVPHITAIIGNPTYLGLYLVASIPFVWNFFKKYASLPVIVAIVLCKSDTAYSGLAFMVLIWLFSFCNTRKKIGAMIILCCLLLGVLCGYLANHKVSDNGRFAVWQQALHEFYNPPIKIEIKKEMSKAQKAEARKLNGKKYVMTGLGLGSFSILNKTSSFGSIHNVYISVLYSTGIIGLLLFLSTIFEGFFTFFKRKNKNKTDFLILFSFIFLLLASVLQPTLSVEPIRFLMAFLFCLI